MIGFLLVQIVVVVRFEIEPKKRRLEYGMRLEYGAIQEEIQ